MSPRPFRLRTLVLLASALAAAVTALLTYQAMRRGFSAGSAALAATATIAIVYAISRGVSRYVEVPLAALRREAARLAEGGTELGWRGSTLHEANTLAHAVTRLADAMRQRTSAVAANHAAVTALMDAVSEGILEIARDGRLLRANRAAHRLLRLPAASRGQRIGTLIRNAELRHRFTRVAAGEELPPFELQLDDRRILVSAHPLAEPESGASQGAVVVLVDLTELRRLEDVRRDFVANASHELKTPLTSIRGYSETLLSDDLPPELRRRFLETIRSNAERLQRVVDDLLDLSRIESGRWRPHAERVDVVRVAQESWTTCREAAEEKRVGLAVDGDDVAALADPTALGQIFANLFDNAIRFAREGTEIRVVARSPADGNLPGAPRFVTVEVIDRGAGIPGDALPRIFERFYRVDPSRARAEGGTGLGLAIVKHLVESMGGEVEASSELGRGTTVRFLLPAAP